MAPWSGSAALLALILVPGVIQAQLDSAVALFRAGNRGAAWTIFEPYGKDNAVAAFYLGRTELDAGHYGPAVDWFERAVALDSTNAMYWDRLGQAYAGHALEAAFFFKYKLARRCKSAFEHAVALDSTNLDARTDVIEYYAQAPGIVGGDKDRARAMSIILQSFAPFSGLQSLLLTCRVSHDRTCVRATADTIMSTFPDSALGYVAMARWFSDTAEYDSAFAVLDRRLATRPDDWPTLLELGQVATLSGQRLDQAATALERFIASPFAANPSKRVQLSGAHYRLGHVFALTNQPDSARAEFQLAVALNPKDGDARKALRTLH